MKTLKDIEACKPVMEEDESRIEAVMSIMCSKYDDKWIRVDDLRDAAREWVKELTDLHEGKIKGSTNIGSSISQNRINAQIEFIKHFFNLEDE